MLERLLVPVKGKSIDLHGKSSLAPEEIDDRSRITRGRDGLIPREQRLELRVGCETLCQSELGLAVGMGTTDERPEGANLRVFVGPLRIFVGLRRRPPTPRR